MGKSGYPVYWSTVIIFRTGLWDGLDLRRSGNLACEFDSITLFDKLAECTAPSPRQTRPRRLKVVIDSNRVAEDCIRN